MKQHVLLSHLSMRNMAGVLMKQHVLLSHLSMRKYLVLERRNPISIETYNQKEVKQNVLLPHLKIVQSNQFSSDIDLNLKISFTLACFIDRNIYDFMKLMD